MSRIHVARDRQLLGKFSGDEVAEGLHSGRFQPDDLAWRDPMETWLPLSQFPGLPAIEPDLVPPPLPVEEPATPPAEEGPPWERRQELGFFKAIWQTVAGVFNAPADAFRRMRKDGGYWAPLIFYVILTTACWWVTMAYNAVIMLVNPKMVAIPSLRDMPTGTFLFSQLLAMMLIPFLAAAGAVIASAMYHGVFVLLGAATRPFEATFRALCYSVAPAAVVLLVPACGFLIFVVLAMWFLSMALREVHGTDSFRASVGVVVPGMLCCGALLWLQAQAFALLTQG